VEKRFIYVKEVLLKQTACHPNLSKPEKNIAGACSRVKFVIHKRSFIANCTRNMHAETGNFR